MMTLWCMFRSPLMIGAELTKMDDFTLSLLTNKELLVLPSEDFRGEQLRRSDGEADWKNTSTKTGMITAALFNLSDTDRPDQEVLSECKFLHCRTVSLKNLRYMTNCLLSLYPYPSDASD